MPRIYHRRRRRTTTPKPSEITTSSHTNGESIPVIHQTNRTLEQKWHRKMEEQKCHFYERNQKTDQRIKHRTREEAKEQITAPEKNQRETKDQDPKTPRKARPVGSTAHTQERVKEPSTPKAQERLATRKVPERKKNRRALTRRERTKTDARNQKTKTPVMSCGRVCMGSAAVYRASSVLVRCLFLMKHDLVVL